MTTPNRPSHDLVHIVPASTPEGRATFTTLAPAWLTKDGESFTIDLPPGLAVSGRLMVQKRKERAGEGG